MTGNIEEGFSEATPAPELIEAPWVESRLDSEGREIAEPVGARS